jgi:hypothetical protein
MRWRFASFGREQELLEKREVEQRIEAWWQEFKSSTLKKVLCSPGLRVG